MQVSSASALNILRNAYSADNLNTSTDSTSERLKILQNSAKALESLRENMTTSAEAAKSRAARKLEEAKQQLEMLKSGGYPPEVVARLAAELAHKISAAAAEFASAVATSATSITSAANAAVAAADTGPGTITDAAPDATASTATASSDNTTSGTAQTGEPDGATPARNAYQSIVEDGEQASSGISAEDRKTMEEFKSILQEVRQLMDRAMRELRAGSAQSGSGMAYPLEGQVRTSTTPTSITI